MAVTTATGAVPAGTGFAADPVVLTPKSGAGIDAKFESASQALDLLKSLGEKTAKWTGQEIKQMKAACAQMHELFYQHTATLKDSISQETVALKNKVTEHEQRAEQLLQQLLAKEAAHKEAEATLQNKDNELLTIQAERAALQEKLAVAEQAKEDITEQKTLAQRLYIEIKSEADGLRQAKEELEQLEQAGSEKLAALEKQLQQLTKQLRKYEPETAPKERTAEQEEVRRLKREFPGYTEGELVVKGIGARSSELARSLKAAKKPEEFAARAKEAVDLYNWFASNQAKLTARFEGWQKKLGERTVDPKKTGGDFIDSLAKLNDETAEEAKAKVEANQQLRSKFNERITSWNAAQQALKEIKGWVDSQVYYKNEAVKQALFDASAVHDPLLNVTETAEYKANITLVQQLKSYLQQLGKICEDMRHREEQSNSPLWSTAQQHWQTMLKTGVNLDRTRSETADKELPSFQQLDKVYVQLVHYLEDLHAQIVADSKPQAAESYSWYNGYLASRREAIIAEIAAVKAELVDARAHCAVELTKLGKMATDQTEKQNTNTAVTSKYFGGFLKLSTNYWTINPPAKWEHVDNVCKGDPAVRVKPAAAPAVDKGEVTAAPKVEPASADKAPETTAAEGTPATTAAAASAAPAQPKVIVKLQMPEELQAVWNKIIAYRDAQEEKKKAEADAAKAKPAVSAAEGAPKQ